MCGARRCHHCRVADGPHAGRPRPLTSDDLRWEFGEAESALGVRSTLGAFVDMALSGPPTGGGGKSNGVENAAVQPWRLAAIGRHRCIRARLALAEVTPEHLAVLRAAYGPEDWTRGIEDLQVRTPVRQAFGELINVVLLTSEALAHAARRQAHRPPPAGKPPKDRPSQRRRAATPAEAARRLFEQDPALAGSTRGAAIAAACGEDPARRLALVRHATSMLAEARAAARVVDPQRPRRVRSVQLRPGVEPAPAPLMFASEVP